MSKAFSDKKILLTAIMAIMVFSLSLITLFVSSDTLSKKNLVYCPLQKAWIKKNYEKEIISRNPLDQICMNEREKQDLKIKILLKQAFAIDEKGIFDALEKGSHILESYRGTTNLPQSAFASYVRFPFFLNTKNDFNVSFALKKESFSFPNFSRPPTVEKLFKFDFQIAKSLDQISCNINPRSPPFFI